MCGVIFYFQDWCKKLELNLAEIQSAPENEFIWQLVKDEGANIYWGNPWIGLSRSRKSNGEWMWQAGGALNYQNWAPGQPDAGIKACMYHGSGQWHTCGSTRHFMCKK